MHASYILLLSSWLVLGCRREPSPAEDGAVHDGQVRAAATTKPLTHLAEGELLEGEVDALGVRLPRGFVVRGRFERSVLATGPASASQLGAYLKARVRGGQAELRSDGARFLDVRLPNAPERPLQILVSEPGAGVCELQISDLSPVADLGGSVEERLRRVGRRADGQLLDRTQQQ